MTKCVSVVHAGAGCQRQWRLELPDDATVRQALEAAQAQIQAQVQDQATNEAIAWESASVGIYGEPCGRGDIPRDGDRIELYRALPDDPKERRRKAAGRR